MSQIRVPSCRTQCAVDQSTISAIALASLSIMLLVTIALVESTKLAFGVLKVNDKHFSEFLIQVPLNNQKCNI